MSNARGRSAAQNERAPDWYRLPRHCTPGTTVQRCARCNGTGEIEAPHPTRFIHHAPCPGCGRSGMVIIVVDASGWYASVLQYHPDKRVTLEDLPYLKKFNPTA